MKKNYCCFLLFLFLFLLLCEKNLFAQEVRKPVKVSAEEEGGIKLKYGTGISSRFIWRGTDISEAPALEPSLMLSIGSFSFEVNGAYGLFEKVLKHPDFVDHDSLSTLGSFISEKIALNRVSMGVYYSFQTSFGSFTLGATDYYFSDRLVKLKETDSLGVEHVSYITTKWGNWKGDEQGAHTIEANLRFSGNDDFPVWVLLALNIHNDPEYPLYTEFGYSTRIMNSSFRIFSGGVIGGSKWYQFTFKEGKIRGDLGLINAGIEIRRRVPINDWLSLDISVSDIINFYLERNTVLFRGEFRVD